MTHDIVQTSAADTLPLYSAITCAAPTLAVPKVDQATDGANEYS